MRRETVIGSAKIRNERPNIAHNRSSLVKERRSEDAKLWPGNRLLPGSRQALDAEPMLV